MPVPSTSHLAYAAAAMIVALVLRLTTEIVGRLVRNRIARAPSPDADLEGTPTGGAMTHPCRGHAGPGEDSVLPSAFVGR